MSLSSEEQLSLLMDVNMLTYEPPIDGSLVNTRQTKKLNFTPMNYDAGQTAQIQINSGSDYVSGPTSYITLRITNPAAPTLKWNATDAPGSAFNIFKEFELTHSSGDIIDRVDNLNALVSILLDFSQDSNYQLYAEVFGYNQAALELNNSVVYAFPLWLFSGFFAQKALIPAHALAGSKIRIQLEDHKVAGIYSDAAIAPYKITEMSLVLDSLDLFDAAKKVLMTAAANVRTQGLQYPYYSYFNLRKTELSNTINFDLNLSAAKTMILIVKARLLTSVSATAAASVLNSMESVNYAYKSWRARIGSLAMPQHEVMSAAESYIIAQEAFSANPINDIKDWRKSSVGVSYKRFAGPHSIAAISLEKNTIVALSGEPTNNSRLLNWSATVSPDPGSTIQYDAWIKHLRVLNIMMDNVVVDK